MTPNNCSNCGSDLLLPKMDSRNGTKWVHCDGCGKCSQPSVSNDRDELIVIWNVENPVEVKPGS